MLYNVLLRMIESGSTDGLREKIDVLYVIGRLTDEQYNELQERLG